MGLQVTSWIREIDDRHAYVPNRGPRERERCLIMRLLCTLAVFAIASQSASADLCFDLTSGGVMNGANPDALDFTDTFNGVTYTLTVSSAEGAIRSNGLGLGVLRTGGGGNQFTVDGGETITFTITPGIATFDQVDGTLFSGQYATTNGIDTVTGFPGALASPGNSITFTPSSNADFARFTKLAATAPEPGSLSLAAMLAIPALRRRRRRKQLSLVA